MSGKGSCSPRVTKPASNLKFDGRSSDGGAPARLVRQNRPSPITAAVSRLPSNHGDIHPAKPHPSVSSDTADNPNPHAQTKRSAERAARGTRSARNSKPPMAQLPSQIAAATAIKSARCQRLAQLEGAESGGGTKFHHNKSGRANQTSTRLTELRLGRLK